MEIFQTFEHNGRVLQLATYEPASSPKPQKATSIRTPGAGKFEIAQINLSDDFTLTAHVTGKNISYIFTEILLKDKSADQFYGPVTREYIQADQNKETGGISRPDWDDSISLSVKLRPSLTLLTNGVDSAFAFATPEGYGVSGCRLDGQYTSAESQTRARITFNDDGSIKEILTVKEKGTKSTPHALTPKTGDTFAPFVQVLTAEDDGKWQVTSALSTPLTFGEQPFKLQTESPLPGEYLAGIVVQDLDGGLTRKYIPMAVK
jgi:hypothetical protein